VRPNGRFCTLLNRHSDHLGALDKVTRLSPAPLEDVHSADAVCGRAR